jgi:hypothetical protein
MRVLISGLPLFSKRLAKDLSIIEPTSRFRFMDTYNSKWAKIKFLLLLPFCDVVISFNGVSDQSGSLDWVLFFRKKLVMQWMGTDLLLAEERMKNCTINRKYIDYATHFHDSVWFGEELKALNISSTRLDFKYGEISTVPVAKYEAITVLAYIAQTRQAFYGFDETLAAAWAYPEISFNIIGMNHTEDEVPNNMKLLGWQTAEEVNTLMKACGIYIRLTKHDGFSVTLIEALATGAEVIWSYKADNCHYAQTKEELIEKIRLCSKLIEERNYMPNLANIEMIKTDFSKAKITTNYCKKLHDVAGK